jgi:hypothetical protein
VQAQPAVERDKSGIKAFALNLLLPGLGQRYLDDGQWNGWAPVFTGADMALALSAVGTVWYRNQQLEAYRTLATGSAGADIEGKDRSFFVQMAAYRSQQRYVEHLLRSRQWANLQQAEDPSRFWSWRSDDAWERYKRTRNRVDALGRRRTILITAMIANRVVSGITALLQANSDREIPEARLNVRPDGRGQLQPHIDVRLNW